MATENLDEFVKGLGALPLRPGTEERRFSDFEDLRHFFQNEYDLWKNYANPPIRQVRDQLSHINQQLQSAESAQTNPANAQTAVQQAWQAAQHPGHVYSQSELGQFLLELEPLGLLMPHKSRLNKLFRVVHSRRHEHTESDQTRSVGA